jgi:hypothetical protein
LVIVGLLLVQCPGSEGTVFNAPLRRGIALPAGEGLAIEQYDRLLLGKSSYGGQQSSDNQCLFH